MSKNVYCVKTPFFAFSLSLYCIVHLAFPILAAFRIVRKLVPFFLPYKKNYYTV